MTYREAQFFIFQTRAMRAHAEIVSGAYKHRDATDGSGKPFTEEQLLQDKIAEMDRHIHFMAEAAEKFEVG
jgi:hypothetical protein